LRTAAQPLLSVLRRPCTSSTPPLTADSFMFPTLYAELATRSGHVYATDPWVYIYFCSSSHAWDSEIHRPIQSFLKIVDPKCFSTRNMCQIMVMTRDSISCVTRVHESTTPHCKCRHPLQPPIANPGSDMIPDTMRRKIMRHVRSKGGSKTNIIS